VKLTTYLQIMPRSRIRNLYIHSPLCLHMQIFPEHSLLRIFQYRSATGRMNQLTNSMQLSTIQEAGRIRKIKKKIHIIGSRIRDFFYLQHSALTNMPVCPQYCFLYCVRNIFEFASSSSSSSSSDSYWITGYQRYLNIFFILLFLYLEDGSEMLVRIIG
jgi:hypothetical protein